MATNKPESINNEFDLDSELDFDDLDFPDPFATDDRKPVVKFTSGLITGAADGLRDTAFLKTVLRDVLPKGYGQTMDAAGAVKRTARDIYDGGLKEIRPAINDFKKAAVKLIPPDNKLVPKAVSEMLKRWSSERDEAASAVLSQDAQRESMLSSTMIDIFESQVKQNVADKATDAGKDQLRQGIEMTRHKDMFAMANASALSLSRLEQYQSNITLRYQKKSLELQYRQLFATQDMLANSQKSDAKRDQFLTNITKNTALPEFVKINLNEGLKQVALNKFYESASDGLFGGRNKLVQKTLERVKNSVLDSIKGVARGVRAGLSGATDMGEQAAGAGDMPGADGVNMAGNMVGGMAAQASIESLIKRAKDENSYLNRKFDLIGKARRADERFKISERGTKLENALENAPRTLEDYRTTRDNDYDPSIGAWFKRTFQQFVPNMAPDTQAMAYKAKDMGDAFSLDTRRTDKTINEIIPGYLARILREIQVTRTGNENTKLTEYSHDDGAFVSSASLKKKIFQDIVPQAAVSRTQSKLDALADNIDANSTLSPAARDALKRKLLKNAAAGKSANVENLAKFRAYRDESEAVQDELVPLVKSYLESLSPQKQLDFSRLHNSAADGVMDARGAMQQRMDLGGSQALKRMRVLGKNGQTIDVDALLEHYLKTSNGLPPAGGPGGAIGPGDGVGPGGLGGSSGIGGPAGPSGPSGGGGTRGTRGTGGASGAGAAGPAGLGGLGGASGIIGLDGPNGPSGAGDSGLGGGERGRRDELSNEGVPTFDPNGPNAPEGFRKPSPTLGSAIRGNESIGKALSKIESLLGASAATSAQGLSAPGSIDASEAVEGETGAVASAANATQRTRRQRSRRSSQSGRLLISSDEDSEPGILGKAILSAGNSLKAGVLKGVGKFKTAVQDVYVKGESSPRLLELKLSLGKYRDKLSGKVIEHQSEITGDVMEGPTVVLSATELARAAFFDLRTQSLSALEGAKNKATGALGQMRLGQIDLSRQGLQNAIARGLSSTRDAFEDNQGEPKDVYLQGQETPRLYAAKLKEGHYYLAETGEKIFHHSEITGEVRDESGSTVVQAEEIDQLRVYDPKTREFSVIRSVGRGLGKLVGALWYFQTRVAPKMVAYNFRLIGKALKLSARAIKSVLGFGRSKVKDVYVRGESEPRLYASKLKEGHYRLRKSGMTIYHQDDISGELEDTEGQVVLNEEDLDNLQVYDSLLKIFNPFKLVAIVGKALFRSAMFVQKKTLGLVLGIGRLAGKAVGSVFKRLVGLSAKPSDVYVSGSNQVSLYGSVMKNGGYFSSATQRPIATPSDIDGEIKDEDGQVVLSFEDVEKGLLDARGQPIKTTLGSLVGKTLGAIGKLFSMRVKQPTRRGRTLAQDREARQDDLRQNMSERRQTAQAVASERTVVLLEDIKAIFKDKFSPKKVAGDIDGDGVRENSLQDKQNKKRAAAAAAAARGAGGAAGAGAAGAAGAAGGAGSGVLGALGTGLMERFLPGAVAGGAAGVLALKAVAAAKLAATVAVGGAVGAALGYATDAAAGAVGAGGNAIDQEQDDKNWMAADKSERFQSGIARGFEKVGSLLFMDNIVNSAKAARIKSETAYLADKVGDKTGLTEKLGTPVALASGVGALASYANNKLSGLMARSSLNAFDKLRHVQYGFPKDVTEHASAVSKLERYLEGFIQSKQGTLSIKEKDLSLKELLAPFGLDHKNDKHLSLFFGWYQNRFKAVFLTHITAMDRLAGKPSLSGADALKEDDKKKLAQAVRFPEGRYEYDKLPLLSMGFKPTTVKEVDQQAQALIDELDKQSPGRGAKANNASKVAAEAAALSSAIEEKEKGQDKKPSGFLERLREKISGKKNSEAINARALMAPLLPPPDAEIEPREEGEASPALGSGGANAGTIAHAGGERGDGRNAMSYIKLKGKASLQGVNPALLKHFYGMVEEYGKLTGNKVGVNSGFRSYADQERAHKADPKKAAKPGNSLHEFGLALDIDSVTLNQLDKMGLMRKYGFTRPVGGEPWHMEPAGIQSDPNSFKRNIDAAVAAIEGGVGRGGGGYGTVLGASLYRRNKALAMASYNASTTPNVDNKEKDGTPGMDTANVAFAPGTPAAPAPPQAPGFLSKVGGAIGAAASAVGGAMGLSAAKNPNLGAAGADGEVEPKSQGNVGAKATGLTAQMGSAKSMPADPSVKVPAPSGKGYAGLKDTITAAAKLVGLDPDVAMKTAAVESGFNPDAKAKTSSASGLFQFVDNTWSAVISKYGRQYGYDASTSPFDVKANAIMGAHYLKETMRDLGNKTRRTIGATEAYIGHFMGGSGGARFLNALDKTPDASAAAVMPSAAKSNTAIFYDNGRPRTLAEVYSVLNDKVNNKLKSMGGSSSVSTAAPPVGAVLASASAVGAAPVAASAGLKLPGQGAPSALTPAKAVVAKYTATSAPTQMAGSPLADAYGFKPTQAAAAERSSAQPSGLGKEMFATSEQLLGQSVEVQQKMLSVLSSIFGIVSQNAGTVAAPTPLGSSGSPAPYAVPKAPVSMRRATT